MSNKSQVLLVTDKEHKDGEPGHEHLDLALEERGITSAWAVWDDPFVDWAAADLVVLRSAPDYSLRLPDFLGWASSIGPSLLHGVEVFRWNTDKGYIADLAKTTNLPMVPSVIADNPVDLRAAISRYGTSVVKPRVGSAGRGIVIVYDAETWLPVDKGPWLVQPLMDSVHHEGEVSVFVINGHPVSQVRKVAGRDDIRVHEKFGGETMPSEVTTEAALLAVDAVAATTERVATEIVYARVDMLRYEGKLRVGSIEVTDPSLYLDVAPENGAKLADAIQGRLA